MERKYTFYLNPLDCQPTGHCDFSKIYNQNIIWFDVEKIGNKISQQYGGEKTKIENKKRKFSECQFNHLNENNI